MELAEYLPFDHGAKDVAALSKQSVSSDLRRLLEKPVAAAKASVAASKSQDFLVSSGGRN